MNSELKCCDLTYFSILDEALQGITTESETDEPKTHKETWVILNFIYFNQKLCILLKIFYVSVHSRLKDL